MKKNIALILFCIGFFNRINAIDDFTCVDLGEVETIRESCVVQASTPTSYEGLLNPDRSLGSKIMTFGDCLRESKAKLDKLKLPYISTEEYDAFGYRFVEIQKMFNDLKKDHEKLRKQDGYLWPLSEPNRQTMDMVRKMAAAVGTKLEEVTFKMNALERDLDSVIERAGESRD